MAMNTAPKYPSMRHLPWSQEAARANKYLDSVDGCLFTEGTAVMTEKIDGSNVCLTRENLFARSHSHEPEHASFDRLKARWPQLRYRIPEQLALYGEWVYATHSITYDRLSDYLIVFSVLDTDRETWLSWDDTTEVANDLGVEHVPVLRRGEWNDTDFQPEPTGDSAFGDTREGYVVRTAAAFDHDDFERAMAKCVRANHVQTDEHWRHGPIETNAIDER